MTAAARIASTPPPRKEHGLNAASRTVLKLFGQAVATRRAERKLSRRQLAEAVEVSYATISHIENGENWPTVPVYLALCRVLKVGRPPLT